MGITFVRGRLLTTPETQAPDPGCGVGLESHADAGFYESPANDCYTVRRWPTNRFCPLGWLYWLWSLLVQSLSPRQHLHCCLRRPHLPRQLQRQTRCQLPLRSSRPLLRPYQPLSPFKACQIRAPRQLHHRRQAWKESILIPKRTERVLTQK